MLKHTSISLFFLAAAVFGLYGTAVVAQDDIAAHRSCIHCGMDRKAFGFSRMLVHYEDGTEIGVCSIRCAVIELDLKQGRKVKAILTADRDSRVLIDAMQATWVIGGAKRGVMTSMPKWAFVTKATAEAFIDIYGGTIITWSEALIAARDDLAQEVR